MHGLGLTDTHCHLNHEQFDNDRDAVLSRSREAGVKRLLVIGFDLASSRSALQLAVANSDMQAVIGIHPEAAVEWNESAQAELTQMAKSHPGNIAAWGEIGLDYHWQDVPRDLQQRVFEAQIECARDLNLPIVIHCREAYADVIATLQRMKYNNAVMHCFTGSIEEAKQTIELGLYLGVGGIVTYKKSDDLRAAIKSVGLYRIIIETDCPYLAPQQWRGKRNEPAYIVSVAEKLAEIFETPIEEIAEITSANASRLFGAMHD